MKKNIKLVLIIVAVIMVLCAIVPLGFLIKQQSFLNQYKINDIGNLKGGDKIHFLNVKNSDAILIESNGRFGLIDAAEDNDNPRNFKGLQLEGSEDIVIDYLKKYAGDENGKVTLDFVMGTHAHSDHIGGFDTLINHKDFTVKKAYLKRYDEKFISEYEIKNWDNKEVYNQMVEACKDNNVELIQDLADLTFDFENFNIKIFNGEEPTEIGLGENENSLGILVTKGDKKIFLAGDMNNLDGDEDRLAPLIGKVDILKLGHHGYEGSSSKNFIKTLDPKIAIVTNFLSGLDFKIAWHLFLNKTAVYASLDTKGLIIDLTNEITLYK